MFKKTFLALCLSLFSCALYASHIEGGELRYEFNGVNYTVHLKVIVHCGGINPGAAHTIKFFAPS